MSQVFTTSLVAVAIVMTVATGIWHRRVTLRWNTSDLKAVAGKLDELPADCGDWKLEESFEVEPVVNEILRCDGYVHRRYVNQESGKAMDVIVMVGPSDTLAIHTPEICYRGAGFAMDGKTKPMEVLSSDGKQDQVGIVAMKHVSDQDLALVVAYGWALGDTFSTPNSPRWTYRHVPYLYKIQISTQVFQLAASPSESQAAGSSSEESLIQGFLIEFLSALRPHLVEPAN